MRSATPGIVLVIVGALVTYWAVTQLGLFVPKGTGGTSGKP